MSHQVNDQEFVKLTVDPTVGPGVAARIGAIGQRDNAGTGELWQKTGAAATAWTQLGSGGGGGPAARVLINGYGGNLSPSSTVGTVSGTTVTMGFSAASQLPQSLNIGDSFTVTGAASSEYNGNFTVDAKPSASSIQYTTLTPITTPTPGGFPSVNFPFIKSQTNVSTVTDITSGRYIVNFSSPLSNRQYQVTLGSIQSPINPGNETNSVMIPTGAITTTKNENQLYIANYSHLSSANVTRDAYEFSVVCWEV